MRDREWPSYTRVARLMRQVGRHWQTYTSASNENLYTHMWTGPFYGFRHVIETYENTERPRRVAPVNVYYHYYSGERVASLAALQYVHEWVLRQSLARIFTSEYLAIVEGFRTARIARVPEGWRISGHGALSTVRFDDTRAHLDLDRSSGVLGYLHHQGALYVHLAGPGPALIALRDRPPATAYLVQASHRVAAWKREAGRVALALSGLGEKVVGLGGVAAYAALGDRDRQIATLEAATRQVPRRRDVRLQLADVYRDNKTPAAAARVLEELTAEPHPDDGPLLDRLLTRYLWVGDYERQLAVLRKLVALEPTDLAVVTDLASVARSLNRQEDALAVLEAYARRRPPAVEGPPPLPPGHAPPRPATRAPQPRK